MTLGRVLRDGARGGLLLIGWGCEHDVAAPREWFWPALSQSQSSLLSLWPVVACQPHLVFSPLLKPPALTHAFPITPLLELATD